MEEKKKYRFADEKEQLKRVNSFLATGYTIFYIVILSVTGNRISEAYGHLVIQGCSAF